MEAIDARDWRELAEELGDLLLQSVFFAQMASEAGHFKIEDSIDAINNKLIRRYPHIFGIRAHTAEDAKKRWDEIRMKEKKAKGESPKLLLDRDLRRTLPALVEAARHELA